MESGYNLPVLRRRLAALDARMADYQQQIETNPTAPGTAALVSALQNAQSEADELRQVIFDYDYRQYSDKPKIPIHVWTFIAALVLWSAVTVGAWLIFAR